MFCPFKDQYCAAKRKLVELSTTVAGFSSDALVAIDEITLMFIVSYNALKPTAVSDTTLLEGALPKYCRTFHYSLQELLYHLE